MRCVYTVYSEHYPLGSWEVLVLFSKNLVRALKSAALGIVSVLSVFVFPLGSTDSCLYLMPHVSLYGITFACALKNNFMFSN